MQLHVSQKISPFFLSYALLDYSVQWLDKKSKAFEPTYLYTMEKVSLPSFSITPWGWWVLACLGSLFYNVWYLGAFFLQGYFLLPEGARSQHNIRTVNISISARHSCFGNRSCTLISWKSLYIMVCLINFFHYKQFFPGFIYILIRTAEVFSDLIHRNILTTNPKIS